MWLTYWSAVFIFFLVRSSCMDVGGFNFNITPDGAFQQIQRAIADAQQTLNRIGSLRDDQCTVENVIEALGAQEAQLTLAIAPTALLYYVAPDKQVKDACVEVYKLVDVFEADKKVREDLFRVTKALIRNLGVAIIHLDPETKLFIDKLMLNFRKGGLYLPPDQRNALLVMRKRLAVLERTFQQNSTATPKAIWLSAIELTGVPKETLGLINEQTFHGAKYYGVGLNSSVVSAILTYAVNPATREKVERESQNDISPNETLLQEIVELRAKCAHLLGYDTHASMVLEDGMAKSWRAVRDFEVGLLTLLRPIAQQELDQLKALKAAELGRPVDQVTIYSWDKAYYARILKERKFPLVGARINEYFQVDYVINEMLRMFGWSLGLRFTETRQLSVWHPDVRVFQVNDDPTGELLGFIYLDLYSRPFKFNRNTNSSFVPGFLRDKRTNDRQVPSAVILLNLSKPTTEQPTLLRHDQLKSLLHEFGHAMHSICAKTKYSRFHGTSVERDFCEAPSQMFENWCWNRSILKRFSKHYRTGQSVSDDQIETLLASEKFMAGLETVDKISFGMLDNFIHTMENNMKLPTGHSSIRELYAEWNGKATLISTTPGTFPISKFGHLVLGYDAGYYGYMWSLVYSTDMFVSRFEVEGIDNPITGMSYRREILQPGGSRPGMDSVRAFLGREPNQEAFSRSLIPQPIHRA